MKPGRCIIPMLMFGGVLCAAPAVHGASLDATVFDNSGVVLTTQYNPLSLALSGVAAPYGSSTVDAIPGGWIISLSPTEAFSAHVDNAQGGKSAQIDGKIGIALSFDAPVAIQVTLREGGTWNATGNGTVNVQAGGVFSEADHAYPTETVGTGIMDVIFQDAGTWEAVASTALSGVYSAYSLTIDNMLWADVLAGSSFSSADVAKQYFNITITTGGGNPPVAVPLPPAALSGLGTAMLALVFRKRLV